MHHKFIVMYKEVEVKRILRAVLPGLKAKIYQEVLHYFAVVVHIITVGDRTVCSSEDTDECTGQKHDGSQECRTLSLYWKTRKGG